ncbi:hypothetical protein ACMFMG_010326 [Clarireedia jacksonii]
MSTSDSFDNFYFTSNLTDYVCPGFGSARCPPPKACARDTRTGATYCCDTRDPNRPKMGRVCWNIGTNCLKDGTTEDCGDGNYVWCCLSKTEVCTRNSGQINNCWNTAHDTLQDIDPSVLNDTYLSLSSATSALSSWTFDPATLIAATQTSSSSTTPPSVSATSTVSPTSTVSSTSTVSPTSTVPLESNISPTSSPSSHVSGGAIGGIVVGVVAVIALVAGFVIYFSRRRNKEKRAIIPEEEVYKDDKGVTVELHPQPRPHELGIDPPVAELEAGR